MKTVNKLEDKSYIIQLLENSYGIDRERHEKCALAICVYLEKEKGQSYANGLLEGTRKVLENLSK